MSNTRSRNISILEYFNILQSEYLLYELRAKIYPFQKDKQRYKDVMKFKVDKINNIALKNNLKTIFNDTNKKAEIEAEFYNENGVPKNMSKRDKYFYYYIGSDFVWDGKGVKLIHYNFEESIATIDYEDDEIEVDLCKIKRIL